MIAYLSILLTTSMALAGFPAYCILLGALVLFGISYAEQRKLSQRFAAVGAGYMLTMASWQSAGEALVVSTAAYGLGTLFRTALLSL